MCTMPIVLHYIIHMYVLITCMYLLVEMRREVADEVFYHTMSPPRAH